MPTKKKAPHQRSRAHAKKPRKKNPLYVVTDEGSVVQEAHGLIDAFIKKMNLGPFIGLMETIFKEMAAFITNYQMFSLLKEWLDQWVDYLTKMFGVQKA